MGSAGEDLLPPPGVDPAIAEKWVGTNQLGPSGVMRTMVNKQGLRLRTYMWPAEGAKGAVIGVHGHGGYCYEFLRNVGVGKPAVYAGSWIEALNRAGWSFAMLDNQSCGLSEGLHGLRCYFERWEDLCEDLLQFARWLGTADCTVSGFAGLPKFLVGVSKGGGLSAHTMHYDSSMFRGAVLLAPMLSLERISRTGINPYIRPVSTLLSAVAPAWQLVTVEKSPINQQLQAEWDQDPLTYTDATRVRVAAEYLRATEQLCAAMPAMDFPFIVFHSERDTMCDPHGSKQLFRLAQSADKDIRLVNDMWHALVKEDGNERVLRTAIEWMEARL